MTPQVWIARCAVKVAVYVKDDGDFKCLSAVGYGVGKSKGGVPRGVGVVAIRDTEVLDSPLG